MDVCPFTNQPCSQAKVVHITEIKDGVISEHNLCQNCSEQFNTEPPIVPIPLTLPEPVLPPGFLSLIESVLGKPPASPINPSHPPCPLCGTTPADIIRDGKFGCANCYSHFPGVDMVVSQCQMNAIQHFGKVPKRWKKEQAKQQEMAELALDKSEQIKNLKLKLAKAIEVENYEIAGVLKKKIEELKSPQE